MNPIGPKQDIDLPLIDAFDRSENEGTEEGESSTDSGDIDGSQTPIMPSRQLRRIIDAQNSVPMVIEARPTTIFSKFDADDFLSDEHITKLKANKIAEEALRECRTRIQEKNDENKKLRAEKDALLTAIANQTAQQASTNHNVNVRNRIDFRAVHRQNISDTVMRGVSIAISIAMAILTIICIVL